MSFHPNTSESITKELWAHAEEENPFQCFEFLDALIKGKCIGPSKGQVPLLFKTPDEKGSLLTFAKTHSFGEYIFDWGWAQAYERYGIPYYPKLTSMIPFTPATVGHFLGPADHRHELLRAHDEFLQRENLSSAHFLFISPEEVPVFIDQGYLIRESLQYHFLNPGYSDFEGFLSELKTKKMKNIRKERSFPELDVVQLTGEQLTCRHADRMYEFYISTIENKHSRDYLTQDFFRIVFETMKDKILYVEASRNSLPVAGSLFFYGPRRIYGRYWGAFEDIPNLHFELCYYQGIDFCIRHGLEVFEAGAQGEHKIPRGFRPVKIHSAHKIKHPGFGDAIRNFIEEEKKQLALDLKALAQYLPFKNGENR